MNQVETIQNWINRYYFVIFAFYFISLIALSRLFREHEYYYYFVAATILFFSGLIYLGNKNYGLHQKKIISSFNISLFGQYSQAITTVVLCLGVLLLFLSLMSSETNLYLDIPFLLVFSIFIFLLIGLFVYALFKTSSMASKKVTRLIQFTNDSIILWGYHGINTFHFRDLIFSVIDHKLTLKGAQDENKAMLVDLAFFKEKDRDKIIDQLSKSTT